MRYRSILSVLTVGAACLVRPVGPVQAQPSQGQAVRQFEAEVTTVLASRGDRMGYSLSVCPLSPPFDSSSDATYVGRAISGRPDSAVTLVATKAGKVVRWTEFDLPSLEGWLTHMQISCAGSSLKLTQDGGTQRYRWDGRNFALASARDPITTGSTCPHSEPQQTLSSIRQARSCADASRIYNQCTRTTVQDREYADEVISICRREWEPGTPARKVQAFERAMAKCDQRYAAKEGSMYRSFAASCQVRVAAQYARRYRAR